MSLVAVGIGLALSAGPALAINHQNTHEKDSVYSWGSWGMLEPAAGGAGVTFQVIAEGAPAGAVLPPPTVRTPTAQSPVQGPCGMGVGCTFATYRMDTSGNIANAGRGGAVPARFGAIGPGGPTGNGFSVTALLAGDAADHPAVNSTSLDIYATPGYVAGSGDAAVFSRVNGGQRAEGDAVSSSMEGFVSTNPQVPVIVGDWSHSILHYLAYDPNVLSFVDIKVPAFYQSTTRDSGFFVWGQTPTAAELDQLRVGSVVANYTGNMLANGTPLTLQVNFSNATWNGSWNGGRDGAVTVVAATNGTYVTGRVGFNANGVVSGANLVSTTLTAADGSVTGNVTGAVFGGQAGAVGGIVDIHKSTAAYGNARHVDAFAAGRVGVGGLPGGQIVE